MDGSALGLVEMLVVLGGVLALAIGQLVSVRRSQRRDREAITRKADPPA